MEEALPRDLTNPQLWQAYIKTREYEDGQREAIPAHHKLVEEQEREGLRAIYNTYISRLTQACSFRNELQGRTIDQWLSEWKQMHHLLWQHVILKCGQWRTIEVRFGDVGDEEVYHIPKPHDIPREMAMYAQDVSHRICAKHSTDKEKYTTLAVIHYQFIRIHPFVDGNGRIARAITDQLALYFGFPVAMGGYPRHVPKRREAYHKAIRAAANDPSCVDLAGWIQYYIMRQLDEIA